LTGVNVVDLIVTELAVIDVGPEGLCVREVADGVTVEQVRAATGCRLTMAPQPATF